MNYSQQSLTSQRMCSSVLWLAIIWKSPVSSQRWLEEEIIKWNKRVSHSWNISLSSDEVNQQQSSLPKENHHGTSSYRMVTLQHHLNPYWLPFCVSVAKPGTSNHKHFWYSNHVISKASFSLKCNTLQSTVTEFYFCNVARDIQACIWKEIFLLHVELFITIRMIFLFTLCLY